jgi:hypothetical protein
MKTDRKDFLTARQRRDACSNTPGREETHNLLIGIFSGHATINGGQIWLKLSNQATNPAIADLFPK